MRVPKWPVSVERAFDICGREDLEASHPRRVSLSRNVLPHAWMRRGWDSVG